jgi:hypothetical protein
MPLDLLRHAPGAAPRLRMKAEAGGRRPAASSRVGPRDGSSGGRSVLQPGIGLGPDRVPVALLLQIGRLAQVKSGASHPHPLDSLPGAPTPGKPCRGQCNSVGRSTNPPNPPRARGGGGQGTVRMNSQWGHRTRFLGASVHALGPPENQALQERHLARNNAC